MISLNIGKLSVYIWFIFLIRELECRQYWFSSGSHPCLPIVDSHSWLLTVAGRRHLGLLPPSPFIRRTRISRFKLFYLWPIIWLLIFYFYNVNFIWLDSSSNMLYHDYKFITINDITFEKWMVKVLFGRPCHVLVCLINVEGGSIC